MADGETIEVNSDIFAAYASVTGVEPTQVDATLVVACAIDALAKGYGMSDSPTLAEIELEHVRIPQPAREALAACLSVEPELVDGEEVRDGLYRAFAEVSRDPSARRLLNKTDPLSETSTLKLAQIYWSLEATALRRLPISSGQEIEPSPGVRVAADIRVENSNEDYATMKWSSRVNQGARDLGRGQSFRTKGAKLAVLTAARLVAETASAGQSLGACRLSVRRSTKKPTAEIVWEQSELRVEELTTHAGPGTPASPVESGKVLVGNPPEIGRNYQWRSVDDEVQQLWSRGEDSRIWLTGGPGLGKSYIARRVFQQAVAEPLETRPELTIWVDSADAGSATRAFVQAAHQVPELEAALGPTREQSSEGDVARQFLQYLRATDRSWLVVLDNADAASLVAGELVPSGSNRHGRVLLTTLDPHHRIGDRGHVVEVGLFSGSEALEYVKRLLPDSKDGDCRALVEEVGRHPLGLACAVATIRASGVSVIDWVAEFQGSSSLDESADAVDPGGYNSPLSRVWRIALQRAADGLPIEVVQRAALIVAIQDPNGHPADLWSAPEIASWVSGGGSLTYRHGRPSAILRLAEFGIVTTEGSGPLSTRIAMHQLPARAIKESNEPTCVAEAVEALASAWLRRLAPEVREGRGALRANVAAIARALPDGATLFPTLKALARYAPTRERHPPSDGTRRSRDELVRAVESVEATGVSTGTLLVQMELIAAGLSAVLDDAIGADQANHRAVAMAMKVVTDPATDPLDQVESLLLAASAMRANDDNSMALQALQAARRLASEVSKPGPEYADLLVRLAASLADLGEREEAANLRRVAMQHYLVAAQETDHAREARHLRALLKAHQLAVELQDRDRREALATELVERFQSALGVDPELDDLAIFLWWWSTELRDELRDDGRFDELRDIVFFFGGLTADAGDVALEAHRYLAQNTVLESGWSSALKHARLVVARAEQQDAVELGDDLVFLASIYLNSGNQVEAESTIKRALRAYDSVPAVDWTSSREAVTFVELEASRRQRLGLWREAEKLHGVVIDLIDSRPHPGDSREERRLADAYASRAACHNFLGEHNEAADDVVRALKILRALHALDPGDQETEDQLARALLVNGLNDAETGHTAAAVAHVSEVVEHRESLYAAESSDTGAASRLVDDLLNLARVAFKDSQVELATRAARRSLAVLDTGAVGARDGSEPLVLRADTQDLLTRCYVEVQQWEDAKLAATEAVYAHRAVAETRPTDISAQVNVAKALRVCAGVSMGEGDYAQAAEYLEQATALLTMPAELDHRYQSLRASTLVQFGYCRSQAHSDAEALAFIEQGRDILRLVVDEEPADSEAKSMLATALLALAGKRESYDQGREERWEAVTLLTELVEVDAAHHAKTLYLALREFLSVAQSEHRDDDISELDSRLGDLEEEFPDLGGSQGM